MDEVDHIKLRFIRERGWIVKARRGFSDPKHPFDWVTLDEAYATELARFRHWTSFKQRRAAQAPSPDSGEKR